LGIAVLLFSLVAGLMLKTTTGNVGFVQSTDQIRFV